MQIGEVIPPDDSGRDAFARLRYQAHAAFPECLKCATDNGPTAIICEHIEDVCVEESNRVRLRQIKTRNPEYGGWRLADLWSASGALRSIVRAHRAIKDVDDPREVLYDIQLEGFLARDDLIRNLRRSQVGPDEQVARAIFAGLKSEPVKLKLAEARAIVSKLTVSTAPQREVIVASNHRLLAALAGHLPANQLSDIYDRAIELISRAMEGTLAADSWPRVLFAEAGSGDGIDLADKRIDKAALCGPLAPAVTGQLPPALGGLTDVDLAGASDLVQKLRLAGAPKELIDRAKSLRAAASRREAELRSRDIRGSIEVELDDLDNRLLTAGAISLGLHGSSQSPAAAVFADLMERLAEQPAGHDPRSLFHQDPMLLMGGICQLSDRCRYAWRLVA